MEILYGSAFVAIFAYFAFRAKRTDPRFYGFRLASKGGMVFFIGWLVLAIADNYESLKLIRTGGYVLVVVGFSTMFIGFVKHAKIVFNPGQFDAKREVDPGCVFRAKLSTDSDANLPLIPIQTCQSFRRKVSTRSDPNFPV
ncbi:hypothetical protein [Desulfuromonas sp. DDH964]|uniref:hypothetical protein n=1 Tax=Desulfuromonas sp. DDH964 TaxID=1823759 RepID=UPI0012F88854|nr:hypothetical protein [Desulfuromonas sp. DDH964]